MQPKVILIMTDTQRKDMIGYYNNNNQSFTPNLDNLAQESLAFERAYTCQPVCGPARSALFTGTYPHTNGMFANCMSLNSLTKNIGERLMSEGIHTAYIGKWHLDGGDYFGDGKCPLGWDPDYWFDMRNYLDKLNEAERLKSRRYQTIFEEELSESFTFAHQCSNKAIDFVKKHQEEAYFLTVSYDEPHHPFLAPRSFFEQFNNCEFPKSPNMEIEIADFPEHVQLWSKSSNGHGDPIVEQLGQLGLMACNSFVDYEIGRVLAAIKENAEDAIIIYTSDHGDSLGSHRIQSKGPAMYDEITNIPLFIKDPRLQSQGKFINALASHIDLVPTILELFDLERPKCIEGKSLVPILKDIDCEVNEDIFIEFTRYEIDHDGFGGFQPIRCIVRNGYKLVINLLTTDELYHLDSDPYEIKNLILDEKYQPIRDKMHDRLIEWMNETRDPFRGYYWQRRVWRTDHQEVTWDFTGMTRQRYIEKDEVSQLDYATGLPITAFVRPK